MLFEVGETVVYPHHGAATITEVKKRIIKGEEKLYLKLNVTQGDLIIEVPAENVDLVGVRDVIGKEGLDQVFEVLRAPFTEEPTNWSRRYKANLEKLASGDVIKVSEVVRDLWRRDQDRGLSAGEKRMLAKARQILISELALAEKTDEEQAVDRARRGPRLLTPSLEACVAARRASTSCVARRRRRYARAMSTPTIAVIVVAAGSGTRLGHAEPKAFVPLGDGTVLSAAVAGVLGMAVAPHVVLVVPDDRRRGDPVDVRAGRGRGIRRGSTSSRAARPGRSPSRAASRCCRPASTPCSCTTRRARSPRASCSTRSPARCDARNRGIVPALDVVDTIKRVGGDGSVVETVDRSRARAVQTPQGFPRRALDHAYATARDEFTDDAALVAAAGLAVDVVPGDVRAFKITVPADLRRAEQLVAERTPRESRRTPRADAADRHRHRRARLRRRRRHPALAGGPALAGRARRSRATATATPPRTRSATRCSRPRGSATSARSSAPTTLGSTARTARSSSPRRGAWSRRRVRDRQRHRAGRRQPAEARPASRRGRRRCSRACSARR